MSKTKVSRGERKKRRLKKGKKGRSSDVAKARSGITKPDGAGSSESHSATEAAAEYLQRWYAAQQDGGSKMGAEDDGRGWKYKKVRQAFLLKSWPNRARVNADTFKLLLSYARTLPEACAERTLTQARQVAAEAEAAATALAEQHEQQQQQHKDDDDDDEDEEDTAELSVKALEGKRAVLLIQRTRALRMIQVLGGDSGDRLGDATDCREELSLECVLAGLAFGLDEGSRSHEGRRGQDNANRLLWAWPRRAARRV